MRMTRIRGKSICRGSIVRISTMGRYKAKVAACVLLLIAQMLTGCQPGYETQPAPAPIPPATSLPPAPPTASGTSNCLRTYSQYGVVESNRRLPACTVSTPLRDSSISGRMGGADHIDGHAFRSACSPKPRRHSQRWSQVLLRDGRGECHT